MTSAGSTDSRGSILQVVAKRVRFGFARRLIVLISVSFTLFFFAIHFTPVLYWYSDFLKEDWNDSDGDILIVLTADTNPDDIVGRASYWRGVYAVRAWRSGHFRAMVISGGIPSGGEHSIAASLGEFVIGYGVPRDKVFLEERSTNTHENAFYTKQLIENWPGKRVLLTSDYHMFRARRAFEAVGLKVVARPIPDMLKDWNSRLARWDCFCVLAIETLKIIRYWMLGWIRLY